MAIDEAATDSAADQSKPSGSADQEDMDALEIQKLMGDLGGYE